MAGATRHESPRGRLGIPILVVVLAAVGAQPAAAAAVRDRPASPPERLWQAFPLAPQAERESPPGPARTPPAEKAAPPSTTTVARRPAATAARGEAANLPSGGAPVERTAALRPPSVPVAAAARGGHVPLVAILAASLLAVAGLLALARRRAFPDGLAASGVGRSRAAEVGVQVVASVVVAAFAGWLLATFLR